MLASHIIIIGVNGLTGYELNVTAQTEDGSPETICGDPRMLSYQLPKVL